MRPTANSVAFMRETPGIKVSSRRLLPGGRPQQSCYFTLGGGRAMSMADNKRIVQAFYDAANRGDTEGFLG